MTGVDARQFRCSLANSKLVFQIDILNRVSAKAVGTRKTDDQGVGGIASRHFDLGRAMLEMGQLS